MSKDTLKENNQSTKPIIFETVNSEGVVSAIFDWVKNIIMTIIIAFLCFTFLFRVVRVDGTSMYDTLKNDDLLIVSDLFYTPHNSDIVVIDHAEGIDTPIVKRVIAIEGQTIKLDYQNNKVIVDGETLNEPYIYNDVTFGSQMVNYDIPEVVPEGKVFVMGDNRDVSLDSRNARVKLIDVKDIIGKAQFVYFPFENIKYLYS